MSSAPEPVGTLDVALRHLRQLVRSQPALAVEQAQEILKAVPTQAEATLLLGLALSASGRGDEALAALRGATRMDPRSADGWRALSDHLQAIGDPDGADQAYAKSIRAATKDPGLLEPAVALCDGRLPVAERLLREFLRQHPTDLSAMHILAEVVSRLGRYDDAEKLLARILALAPSFTAARHNFALALHRQHRTVEALREIDLALVAEPANPNYRTRRAAMLMRIGEFSEAIRIYAEVLAHYPVKARMWMGYGHALRTAGRQDECIRAYRKSIELAPNLGEAYWSLANLKTFRFAPEELDAMRAQLLRAGLDNEDRVHFDFAVGKALEDLGEYPASFRHYEAANRLRRAGIVYSADENADHLRRSRELFTPEFLAEREGSGCTAPDPIFIVGLPRSGSTLVEQILSSHPLVEGTSELRTLISMMSTLGSSRLGSEELKYPEILATLDRDELRAMGERYLAETRVQRKTNAPFFIDKMPNNFHHVGVIHLILPNAKIIDTRRHPLGCCFSNYKQHFVGGQLFTYSLEDIGRYYRDYVQFMAHFDSVLPGRVHRVIYERVVEDTESEVRRLLDYCALPFDPACLRFFETERAVGTASSEQVRQPIFREALDQWRNYAAWLDPLKNALGPVLEPYPAVPATWSS